MAPNVFYFFWKCLNFYKVLQVPCAFLVFLGVQSASLDTENRGPDKTTRRERVEAIEVKEICSALSTSYIVRSSSVKVHASAHFMIKRSLNLGMDCEGRTDFRESIREIREDLCEGMAHRPGLLCFLRMSGSEYCIGSVPKHEGNDCPPVGRIEMLRCLTPDLLPRTTSPTCATPDVVMHLKGSRRLDRL